MRVPKTIGVVVFASITFMVSVTLLASLGVGISGSSSSLKAGKAIRSQQTDLQVSSIATRTPLPLVDQHLLYVAVTGSDQNSGLSPQAPLASIQRAIDLAYPGTKILVGAGRYVGALHTVRNGSLVLPIVLQAEGAVELRGDAKTSHLVDINHSYIHLTGFHVNGLRGSGNQASDYIDKVIYVQGKESKSGVNGLKLSGLIVENAGGECIRFRYFAVNNEVSHTIIRHCGVHDFQFKDGGKNGEGIYLGTAPEQLADGKNPTADRDESHDNWIHDNVIDTQGNECVDIKEAAHHNRVDHNECTGQKDPNSGGVDSRGNNNSFTNNNVHDVVGAGFRLGGDAESDGIQNTVMNNVISRARVGIKVLRGPQSAICGNRFDEINSKESPLSC